MLSLGWRASQGFMLTIKTENLGSGMVYCCDEHS